MPWTFSHPAVVFPIKQSRLGKFLNLPALIIGSISPDLFYSVGLYSLSTKAHHFIGWFYTAFPVCIVIFVLISILSSSLNKILPIPIEPYTQWNLKGCIVIIVSLFIGAAILLLGLLYLCMKYWQYHCKLNIVEQINNKQKFFKLLGITIISAGVILPFAVQFSYKKTSFQLNNFIFNQLRLTELAFFIIVMIYTFWIQYRKSSKP